MVDKNQTSPTSKLKSSTVITHASFISKNPVLGEIEYHKGGFNITSKRAKESSKVLLHDIAVEDCMESEKSSTSKARTSLGDNFITTISCC